MPQKSNQDFKEKYPNVRTGILELMRIKDILTKNRFFAVRKRFRTRQRNKNAHGCLI